MHFNFSNFALLSKRCHLIALWMFIMVKRVFWSYHSVEKNVKSFSKGSFLSHFLIFLFCYKLSIECSISIISCCFWILGSLIKTYTTMYFITWILGKLFLLIIFYFSGTLLHYPIFLLPLDEFIANNEQS